MDIKYILIIAAAAAVIIAAIVMFFAARGSKPYSRNEIISWRLRIFAFTVCISVYIFYIFLVLIKMLNLAR